MGVPTRVVKWCFRYMVNELISGTAWAIPVSVRFRAALQERGGQWQPAKPLNQQKLSGL